MTDVPTRVRQIVWQREQGRCLRCAGAGSEYAHRRTRSVGGEHRHCPCNGWYACYTCHQKWQHAQPIEAIATGFAVSRFEPEPRTISVDSWYGRIFLLCDGDIEFYVEGVHTDVRSS